MPVEAVTNQTAASAAAYIRYADDAAGLQKPHVSAKPTQSDVQKVARQFEAIILRQLLAPSIEPLLSGGLGTSHAAGSGGGMYGFMLTDSLADNLSKGGGLGLARMLETQLSPKELSAQVTSSAALKLSNKDNKS